MNRPQGQGSNVVKCEWLLGLPEGFMAFLLAVAVAQPDILQQMAIQSAQSGTAAAALLPLQKVAAQS